MLVMVVCTLPKFNMFVAKFICSDACFFDKNVYLCIAFFTEVCLFCSNGALLHCRVM